MEQCNLQTADGFALEAELHVPKEPVGAAVLAHPHPEQGGSMRSLVTSELFRALPGRGVAVLRFNFRGVEGSEGTFGGGTGEQADIAAGIDALAARVPGVPLMLAGWSFGADVSLAVTDERLLGWFAIAPPLRTLALDALAAAHDPRPKLLAVPEHDPFNPPERCRKMTADWTATRLEVIEGGDHFLVGRTNRVVDLLADRFA